jgi:hypothetical protein
VTLRERCPSCADPRLLIPAYGRDGGERLCLTCGHERRKQLRLPENRCGACGSVLLIHNNEAVCCRRGCERYGTPAPSHEERSG